jgi:hypothetical protein
MVVDVAQPVGLDYLIQVHEVSAPSANRASSVSSCWRRPASSPAATPSNSRARRASELAAAPSVRASSRSVARAAGSASWSWRAKRAAIAARADSGSRCSLEPGNEIQDTRSRAAPTTSRRSPGNGKACSQTSARAVLSSAASAALQCRNIAPSIAPRPRWLRPQQPAPGPALGPAPYCTCARSQRVSAHKAGEFFSVSRRRSARPVRPPSLPCPATSPS